MSKYVIKFLAILVYLIIVIIVISLPTWILLLIIIVSVISYLTKKKYMKVELNGKDFLIETTEEYMDQHQEIKWQLECIYKDLTSRGCSATEAKGIINKDLSELMDEL
jgi:competence protein ComGC